MMNSVLSGVHWVALTVQTEGAAAPVKKAATVPGMDQPSTATPPGPSTPEVTGTGTVPVAGSAAGPAPAGAPPKPVGLFDSPIFLIMIFMVGFLLLTSIFGGRKEKKRRAELLSSLGNGDKVMTMGGIIGTITELRDDEVVLKTDEGSNTKIRFTRSAVQQIVKKSGASGVSSSTEVKPAKDAVQA